MWSASISSDFSQLPLYAQSDRRPANRAVGPGSCCVKWFVVMCLIADSFGHVHHKIAM